MKKSEQRQQAVFEYMKEMIAAKGFPPTVREICSALGIKSTSTVYSDIKALTAKGLVKKDPSKPRALTIVSSPEKDYSSASSPAFGVSDLYDSETVELPVIGRVAAGTPILAAENIEDKMPLPARFVGPGRNFILTVEGTSMINVGINDGDYLIIHEEHEANNGDIVVAMINGDFDSEATVKRFFKENGHIRLQPENDQMDPIIVPDCQIVGKVKGVFRFFN